LVYFVHGQYMNRTGSPLVSGTFEAWEFGPVHPHVYHAFRKYGDNFISGHAESIDPVTLEAKVVPSIRDEQVIEIARDVLHDLMKRSPSNLVDVSHAKDGPWDYVVQRVKQRKSVSLRITNDIIRERFGFHKIDVSDSKDREVPNENSPFA
jgi:uncharacterized phage-associated protein